MPGFLKNHPFSVAAYFDVSLVLTYAAPKETLAEFIPECLSLDTFEDRWAFIAVAVVDVRSLRPRGFPEFLGNDMFLVGYRIFVRYDTSYGKRLRGLFIIKSETDRAKMVVLGNAFTHYNYEQTDVRLKRSANQIDIASRKSGLAIKVEECDGEVSLPADSPFKAWKEARRFAGPLPFTFSYESDSREVLIVEGVRSEWAPRPVKVMESRVGFVDGLQLGGSVLAGAFVVDHVPYFWKKGRVDKWKG